ncbi:MAG: glycosyltransferase family 4 protein [Ignavibacteriaceae bacterium]
MKICFATYEGVPLAKGGPYIKILETKKYLENLNHQVELFNMWETPAKLKTFDAVHLVGSNLSIFGLARNLKHLGINFIVEPVFFSMHSPSLIKTISSADLIMKRIIRGSWTDYGILRDICLMADIITPNTTDERNLIAESFSISRDKFKVIPNGVSSSFLNADPELFKKKYGLEKFILNVGHIGPKRKNILNFIKALNKIDYPAVIIGKYLNMGESSAVKREADKNKNILFIDELPNDSPLLASAYAACSCFVLPSLYETPGIAALEAALAGAKVVITKHGGTKDYFKDMAEYVDDPLSPDSIAGAVKASLHAPKDGRLREFIKQNFLWEKITERSLDIYQSLKR